MSDDEKAEEAKREEAERKKAAKRGHFISTLEDYPGFFELPHPFLDRHMKLWWKSAIDPLNTLTPLDFDFYDGEWTAAVSLIQKYGEWAVENVSEGDLESDEAMPSVVKAWVMRQASSYIYPFLPQSIQRRLLGIT